MPPYFENGAKVDDTGACVLVETYVGFIIIEIVKKVFF